MRFPLAGLLATWLFACSSGPRPASAVAPAAAAPERPAQAAPAAVPGGAWSEASFDAELLAAIRHRFPDATVAPLDADSYRIAAPPPGASLDVAFTKAHRRCRDDWASCQTAVDWTLRAVAEALQPPPIQAAQLRVVLRGNPKVSVYQQQGDLTVRPFSSDAQWLLVADLPTTIRFRVKPAELGMTLDEAWRTAERNMKKPPEALISGAIDAAVIYHDAYAPSALLDPAALEQAVRIRFPGRRGTLYAVSPEETVVLYTLGDPSDAAGLRAAAVHVSGQAQLPISNQVMQWSHGAWQPAP
jgi:hypothetical protein